MPLGLMHEKILLWFVLPRKGRHVRATGYPELKFSYLGAHGC